MCVCVSVCLCMCVCVCHTSQIRWAWSGNIHRAIASSYNHVPAGVEVPLHPHEHRRKDRGRNEVKRIVGHDLTGYREAIKISYNKLPGSSVALQFVSCEMVSDKIACDVSIKSTKELLRVWFYTAFPGISWWCRGRETTWQFLGNPSDPLPEEELRIRHFLLFHTQSPKLCRGIGGDLGLFILSISPAVDLQSFRPFGCVYIYIYIGLHRYIHGINCSMDI